MSLQLTIYRIQVKKHIHDTVSVKTKAITKTPTLLNPAEKAQLQFESIKNMSSESKVDVIKQAPIV